MELYKKGHEAGDKFDYFVCTVAGAIFAYDAEHYVPRRLDFSFHLFEPVSLLLLALAFFFGLKRIEHSRTVTQLNHDLVVCEDRAQELAGRIQNPEPTRDLTGQICDKSSLELKRQKCLTDANQNMTNIESFLASSKLYQQRRDILLVCGFAAIFLAKVLQPYGADFSAPATATAQPAHIQSPSVRPVVFPTLSPLSQPHQTNRTTN